MQCRTCLANAAYPECALRLLPAHLSCREFETALCSAILARETPCGISEPVFISVTRADGASPRVDAPLHTASSTTYEYCVCIDDEAFDASNNSSGWAENGTIVRGIVDAVAKRIGALPGVTSEVRVSHAHTRTRVGSDTVMRFSFTKMH